MAFGRSRTIDAPEERAFQIMPWGDWSSNNGNASASGAVVSQDSATQLLTVYGCVQLISDTIATLPRDVYRKNSDGSLDPVSQSPKWLDQPNDYTRMTDFIVQSLVSLLLDGNAYWVHSVNRNLAPTELFCVNPQRVTVKSNKGAGYDDESGIAYFIDGQAFRGRLVHIRGILRPGALKGLSPVEAARQSVGIGLAAQEYAARFYSNGASLSGVIQTPMDLTADQAKQLAEKFGRMHSGTRNAHKPGILDNGATWNQISVTPEQAQFLATREFQAAEIAGQMFLVDPAWFSISAGRGQNLTYANQEQRGVHLAQFTLLRWVKRLEEAFSYLLPSGQELKFNMDELKRADMQARFTAYQIALGGAMGTGTAWMEVDEIRKLEDLGPSSQALKDVNKPPEPVAPPHPVAPVVPLPAPNPTSQKQAQAK